MKNVTLALDEDILEAGREYARQHRTSLNRLIRKLLEQTVAPPPSSSGLAEFLRLAKKANGHSRGWKWRRTDLYDV